MSSQAKDLRKSEPLESTCKAAIEKNQSATRTESVRDLDPNKLPCPSLYWMSDNSARDLDPNKLPFPSLYWMS